MKNRHYLAVLVLMAVSLTACHDDNNGNDTNFNAETLGSVTYSKYVNPDEFFKEIYSVDYLESTILKALRPIANPMFKEQTSKQRAALDCLFRKEVGTAANGQRNWHIEFHHFTFHSKSARGEDIVLTGSVAFPNYTIDGVEHKVKSLTIHSEGAVPTVGDTKDARVALQTLRVYFNSAVIIPEYQGVGSTLGTEVFCFASSKTLTRQMADCALAAMQVMQQHGVTLADDGYTLISGSSQKAVLPIAFAKWYETAAPQWFREQLKMKIIFSYGGPLDYKTLFEYMSEHPDYNAMLTKGLVASLAALSPSQLGGYQPEEFMAQIFFDTKVKIDGQEMTYYEAVGKYQYNMWGTEKGMPTTTHLSDILAADMLTSDGKLNAESPKTQAFMRVLTEQNDIYDWTPSSSIYFLFCPQDNVIPYEPSYNYYNMLSAHATKPNLHWGDINIPPLSSKLLDQIVGGHHIVSNLIPNIRMYIYEYPKDMLDNWEH